ncbi:outer membrane beta-barrel protein [Sphingobacterium arenae]|uniref:Outer membrane beta-barrel protein n=1 Tax=Sphingobacterium arenae TaxID=1280598 RepID=A0ABR7Y1Y1_9SPHI|nr:outer membrane beta-barrel protein [Sphingobacterium arenae]MBD1425314.1 outer membrane beta-barrel protein [Sphingobacterium arenae]
MKDRNKELIELIKEGLKNAEELPYKEGAWEAYKAKYESAGKVTYFSLPWVAAAAVVLVGLTFLFHDWKGSTGPVKLVETKQEMKWSAPTAPLPVQEESNTRVTAIEGQGRLSSNNMNGDKEMRQDRRMVNEIDLQAMESPRLTNKSALIAKIHTPDRLPSYQGSKPVNVWSWDDNLIAGETLDPNFAHQHESARHLSPKKLRLTDRFELGAFVSPSTTDQSFDLGGGLVFAYRLNDKIAIRTGASFNQYEVSMLKSQVQEVGAEMKQAAAPIKNTDNLISKEASSLRTNSFFIPNLNAVTGKVQTLDIPLEIRYNVTKEFYATGGVSYAAVLSQERFAHYEESAGIPTYSSASDSEKPVANPVTTVETTQISSEENINTNGFGGFVNFSVGRRVNMGRTLKVSIEPFVKLPVGQFKRADMNYTNGGIRIMTSF